MIERVGGPPWPPGPMVLLLDDLTDLPLEDQALLERRKAVCVAAVRGICMGNALAAAMAADILVAAPDAAFGRPGKWMDIVIRRGTGIAGRKVMAYLAMTNRLIDAKTAYCWGIVSTIEEDPVTAAEMIASKISGCSPVAVATILRQCHRGADRDYINTRMTGNGK